MDYRKFDEKALFELKRNFSGYSFCPRCGRKLEQRLIDHHIRLQCPDINCNFIYYHNPIPAAGALVFDDGKLLMVKRAAPPKAGWWCFPAGFMEWPEHPSQTAIREIEEETGLKIRLDSLFEVYSGQDDPRTNAILILYLATVVGGVLRAGDDAEEAIFFNPAHPPENIAFLSHQQALKDFCSRHPK